MRPHPELAIERGRPMIRAMELDPRTRLLLALTVTFVTCLIVGDLVGGKLVVFTVGSVPVTLSVGMIPFPVTFLLTDLLNEFYGQKVARHVTWLGLGMALLTYAIILVAGALPIAEVTRSATWSGVTADAFSRVFLSSQRIIVGSLAAYVVAQLIDIAIFHALKRATGRRLLWLRATGSTVVSQLVDTTIISVVVWWGVLSPLAVVSVIVSSYLMKLAVAIALTPAVYAGHSFVERFAGLTPLPLEEQPSGAE